MEMKVKI